MERVVVVGAGLAGLQTVAALRGRGYAGALTLVGAEPCPPYDRPPLTKAVLLGQADDTTLVADWGGWAVDRHEGRVATGLRAGILETDAGDLPWDGLVLATGALPVPLPGAESALTLRTRGDALHLRERLRPGARLVIVGAGWIGAEVATAAVRAGVRVTVVEQLDTPLAGALPAACGRRMLPWWSSTDLRLAASVEAVTAGSVQLRGGETIRADTVLVGIGARPATAWLAGTPVELVERGAVAVDGQLRTSLPGAWAVGDVAAWTSKRYGARMHVEHWDNALHAPATAAASMLGAAATWDPVPYFWSEQWGRMVQYAGHHRGADRVIWRQDGELWAAFWLSGDQLVAALAVDRPRDLVQARRLMDRSVPVDPDLLADPAVPVKAAALAWQAG